MNVKGKPVSAEASDTGLSCGVEGCSRVDPFRGGATRLSGGVAGGVMSWYETADARRRSSEGPKGGNDEGKNAALLRLGDGLRMIGVRDCASLLTLL